MGVLCSFVFLTRQALGALALCLLLLLLHGIFAICNYATISVPPIGSIDSVLVVITWHSAICNYAVPLCHYICMFTSLPRICSINNVHVVITWHCGPADIFDLFSHSTCTLIHIRSIIRKV